MGAQLHMVWASVHVHTHMLSFLGLCLRAPGQIHPGKMIKCGYLKGFWVWAKAVLSSGKLC